MKKKLFISLLIFLCTNVLAQEKPVFFKSDYVELYKYVGEETVLDDTISLEPNVLIKVQDENIVIYIGDDIYNYYSYDIVMEEDKVDNGGNVYTSIMYKCIDRTGDAVTLAFKFTDRLSILFIFYDEVQFRYYLIK